MGLRPQFQRDSPLIVGFTGTHKGMRQSQFSRLIQLLEILKPIEFHHGDCIGADVQAAGVVRRHFPGAIIVAHPPINQSKRAYFACDRYKEPKPYLERNHDIVDCCDILLVAPKSSMEELRSGTWATWRYANKLGKRYEILEPLP